MCSEVSGQRVAEVRGLLARVREWAAQRPDVAAVGVAGSWSRGKDSDVDLVVLRAGWRNSAGRG